MGKDWREIGRRLCPDKVLLLCGPECCPCSGWWCCNLWRHSPFCHRSLCSLLPRSVPSKQAGCRFLWFLQSSPLFHLRVLLSAQKSAMARKHSDMKQAVFECQMLFWPCSWMLRLPQFEGWIWIGLLVVEPLRFRQLHEEYCPSSYRLSRQFCLSLISFLTRNTIRIHCL